MKTIRQFVLLSLFTSVIDMIVAGICGIFAFVLCNSVLKSSYALSAALFVFIGTTAYYRTLFVPIAVLLEQKKVKLLVFLMIIPVIFVIGFLYGVCSLIVVSFAYFFVAILMNYECFVTLHHRRKAILG